MVPQREQTITKFNEYLDETVKAVKRTNPIKFTFVLFNSAKYEVREKDTPIKKVSKINYDNYKPQANTPLYDAIGKTVSDMKGPALVVVLTDGQENSSKEYNLTAIQSLIYDKEKDGWTFVFLGSDLTVSGQAVYMGVQAHNTASYRGDTGVAMAAIGAVTRSYAGGQSLGTTQSYVDEAEARKEAQNASKDD